MNYKKKTQMADTITLYGRLELRLAVWLQTKVRDHGLELRLRL